MARSIKKTNDYKQIEAALVLEALAEPVLGFDADFNICFCNHAAQIFWSMGKNQVLGKNLAVLIGRDSMVFEAAENVARRNQAVTLRGGVLDGKPLESVSITVVERGLWYVLAVHPASPQQPQDWREKSRQALQSAEIMTQALAHEIKNPLAGIRGAAQLLGKSDLNAEDKELAELIAHETLRIQSLVERFGIFQETPETAYAPVNLHEALGRAMRIVKAECGDVSFEEKFDPSLPEVAGHFDHLVQACLNLIKNAAEAGGGRITLRTHYDAAAPYHPERPEKLPLCIEVEDNGPGLPEGAAAQVFQPYFTTKTKGQGLGLAIVAKIVDNHGGIIDVSSQPGRTVFKINLPMRRPAA